MRILIWQSYGKANAMAFEVDEHVHKIIRAVMAAMDGWGMDDDIEEMYKAAYEALNAKNRVIMYQVERVIMDFVAPHIGTHETFEYFSFSNLDLT